MEIIPAQKEHCALLASIVSKSNQDVAEMLNLNIDNAPKHPSFCTTDWIVDEIDRGQQYFLLTENGNAKGCVAFEQPNENTAYLNRLSVLPKFRNNGIGAKLVQHIIDYSMRKQVSQISIGIIAEHTQLNDWYLKKRFTEGALQNFDHLPFNVLYMQYELTNC